MLKFLRINQFKTNNSKSFLNRIALTVLILCFFCSPINANSKPEKSEETKNIPVVFIFKYIDSGKEIEYYGSIFPVEYYGLLGIITKTYWDKNKSLVKKKYPNVNFHLGSVNARSGNYRIINNIYIEPKVGAKLFIHTYAIGYKKKPSLSLCKKKGEKCKIYTSSVRANVTVVNSTINLIQKVVTFVTYRLEGLYSKSNFVKIDYLSFKYPLINKNMLTNKSKYNILISN